MPYIRRKTKEIVESTHSEIDSEHELYVKPGRERPGDKRVALRDMDDTILGDLNLRHPREFEEEVARRVKEITQQLKKEADSLSQEQVDALELRLRRLRPEIPEEDLDLEDDDDDDLPEEFVPNDTQEGYLKLDEKAAIEAIEKADNVEVLAEWLEAEEESGRKRKKVLAAFARKHQER